MRRRVCAKKKEGGSGKWWVVIRNDVRERQRLITYARRRRRTRNTTKAFSASILYRGIFDVAKSPTPSKRNVAEREREREKGEKCRCAVGSKECDAVVVEGEANPVWYVCTWVSISFTPSRLKIESLIDRVAEPASVKDLLVTSSLGRGASGLGPVDKKDGNKILPSGPPASDGFPQPTIQ